MGLRPATRQRLLDAAEELFFTQGIAATPVDAVLAHAGVSSATMYRAYPTKEALVAAALERRLATWVELWEGEISRATTDEDRLLAVFPALAAFRARSDASRWCAFLGTTAEYRTPPEEVAVVVQRDTERLRTRLTELAEPLVGARAGALAEQLLLIVSGDLAMRLRGADDATSTAVRAARAVVRAELPAAADVAG
ncbi:TetR family transcriptional regulator [Auraticoccus sp. F435]|uniref:TetR family transcriptional regulator n=1 Tax=Auraticoccus cholistanensis TaxID=2656650 RepID=A0A6A9V111_9ACTN|nr:TetR/AcrR family transcriptional regulator [Auraticoccus cholistanensis]MVA76290.1 TetR family transcriptional regulator [Auraticoccus cholistanensis]